LDTLSRSRTPDAPIDDNRNAKRRIRAANWCFSSYYAAILAAVTLFIPLFGGISLLAAPFALVSGTAGLLWLARLDRLPEPKIPGNSLERVAFKMTRRARKRGAFGVAMGGAVVVLFLFSLGL
jgi:hypothetical protein